MTTYTLNGFSAIYDDDPLSDGAAIDGGPVTLTIVVENKDAQMSYTDPDLSEPDSILPIVDVDTSELLSFEISGFGSFSQEDIEAAPASVGFVRWVTLVENAPFVFTSIILGVFDETQNQDFVFLIGGQDAAFSTLEEFSDIEASIIAAGEVENGPFVTDTPFTVEDMLFDSKTEKDVWVGTSASETVSLGDGADFMDGGLGRDKLYGQKGFDEIYGGKGKDQLYGAGGRDTLDGGTGKDRLEGGTGDDFLTGGDAADVFYYRFDAKTDHDRIRDWEDGIDVIRFKGGSFEELTIEDSGPHVLISWGANSVRLNQTEFADISADDFDFV